MTTTNDYFRNKVIEIRHYQLLCTRDIVKDCNAGVYVSPSLIRHPSDSWIDRKLAIRFDATGPVVLSEWASEQFRSIVERDWPW